MNSWSTTLNEFIRVYGKSFIIGYSGRYIPEGYKEWEDFLSIQENYKHNLPSYIEEFMEVVYTIGNFLPVPSGFNGGRYAPTSDYWDLTLLSIYEYYRENWQESKLAALLKKSDIQNWLNQFGSWGTFVEKNFMQPFVEKQGDFYGRPRELWDGHFTGNLLPQTKEQFEQFFVNAKARILDRGELIAAELKRQADTPTAE